MAEAIKLEGFEALDAQLSLLQDAARGTALRAAMRQAGKVVIAEAESKIPVAKKPHRLYDGQLVGPGYSKRHILQKVRLSPDKQAAFSLIGVGSKAFYAVSFIEKGFNQKGIRKYTKKSGRKPVEVTPVAARPWLVPALREKRAQALDAMSAELRKSIKRAIAKGKTK